MSYASPLIRSGFDDIPFRVLTDGRRPTVADWEVQDYVSERKVASSNQVDVQVMGSGLATVTWTLAFDERAAFLAFRRRRNTLGTLRLPYGIQTLSDEVWVDAGGKRWDLLYLCRPSELRNIASYLGGRVDVDVTFKRAWDPLTDRAEVP